MPTELPDRIDVPVLPPLEVAPETFLLRGARPLPGAPLLLPVNQLLIRGSQPALVDTGRREDRARWLAQLGSVLDPREIRWIVLSHDAGDHLGNLGEVLARCPDATIVTSWSAATRAHEVAAIPAGRIRWVDDGDLLDIGDRALRILRPPVFDSPAARALHDPATGVLWASEAFAAPVPVRAVDRVDELPPRLWAEGLAMLHHHALAPWLSSVDHTAYGDAVQRFRRLDPPVVVGAHSPVIAHSSIEAAFELLGALPTTSAPPHPARPSASSTTT